MKISTAFKPIRLISGIALLSVVVTIVLSLAFTNNGAIAASTTSNTYSQPTWWNKYQKLLAQTNNPTANVETPLLSAGTNVDMSNEDGPQSETAITLNPRQPSQLVGGSNEINRLPMRAYYSSDGGQSWGGVDLPLPPATTTNGTDFGSDPGVAFDTKGNVYYSYIVVFFNRSFSSIQGTEMAVAKSTDGGKTWPQVVYFNYNSGSGKFNDKPFITVDTNPNSPYLDNVYVAWDNASNKQGKSSTNNSLLFAKSTDGGLSFSQPQVLNTLNGGPNSVIGADPFVGPNGEVYVAWHDIQDSAIMVNRSFDGGNTFGSQLTVASTVLPYQENIAAMATRGALVYPACDTDRSTGPNRGTLYCSWMDENGTNGTDILVARSKDNGTSWSNPTRVNDDPAGVRKDQFNQWLSVDPVTGAVDLSWDDTRNDPANIKTDIYFGQSTNGGTTFNSNLKVTNVQTDESSNNPAAQSNDQYGDYEGLVAYGGVAHPIWTDGRLDGTIDPTTGLTVGEEVFTATIK